MNSNNNNKEISNVIRIQGTNDNSILSKCSMIKYGYFNDEFLPFMIGKFSRRAPLINRGYYIRAKAIEHILLTFIENNKHMDAIQIFSLGAGFDTSFFRLHKQGKLDNCTFIELDYFDVAQRKAVLMQQESKLWKCLSSPEHPVSLHKDNYIVINASNYKLIGIDMTKLDILDACIRASGVSYDLPTLFLSECVITYISTKKSASLLKFIAKSFSENCFVLYEQIYPDDSFGRFMCSHFKQLGSSLRGIQTYKTKEMQMERLLHAGWDSATSWDMAEFYYNIVSSEEKSRIEHLEVFDEYEEWLLKCNHYMVLVACRGSVCWRPGPILIDVPVTLAAAAAAAPVSPADPADPADTLRLPPLNLIQYHSANQQQQTEEPQFKFGGIKTHYVKADLIAGNGTGNRRQYLLRSSGYGQNPFSAGHCRLTCLSILDLTTNVMRHIEPARSQLLANSLCGSMTRISGNCFIIFGGRSSPLKPNDLATRLQLHYNADANAADGNAADGNAADGNAADANADNGGGGGGNLWQAECSPLIAVNEADKPSARWRHMAGCYWLHGSKQRAQNSKKLEDLEKIQS